MLIELNNLGFTYMKGTPLARIALRNICLTVKEGEFVGIIGPTGSGKSTLAQLISGLLKATDGQILIDGNDIAGSGKNINGKKKIGMVFQFPEQQFFETTVFDDVAFGLRNMGCSEDRVASGVRKTLKIVGLDFELFKDRSPFFLSGGEMRKVAIACVLAMEPDILVLDEPTVGLDEVSKKAITDFLTFFHNQGKTTIICISHDIEEVSKVAERIVVLDKGELLFDDKPEKIFLETDKLLEIGLDIPDAFSLLIELNKKGFNLPTNVFRIDDVKDLLIEYFIKEQKARGYRD
ncbi:MAG: energy-coupling factor transporter ATPase [Actinobacteria bacterium]|nr:energy-coupling factor transporter ATPase [Actinomycetota bacterium]